MELPDTQIRKISMFEFLLCWNESYESLGIYCEEVGRTFAVTDGGGKILSCWLSFCPNSMHASSTTYDVIADRLLQHSLNLGDGVQYSPWAWEGIALRSKAQSTTNLYMYLYDKRISCNMRSGEIGCIYRTTATSEAPLQESPDVSRQPNLFFFNILLDKYNLRT